ncbi:hypothetical protein [Paenilisteria rocourtiae]|uniref:hypothetical protein n=1 Tax=Listeria rocourtiae TaxID=647910 RepID=UPI0004B468A8
MTFRKLAWTLSAVGYGLLEFLVVDGKPYLLYSEEGIFNENVANHLNAYLKKATSKM